MRWRLLRSTTSSKGSDPPLNPSQLPGPSLAAAANANSAYTYGILKESDHFGRPFKAYDLYANHTEAGPQACSVAHYSYSPLDQLMKVQHGDADFADWDVATAAVQTRTFEYDAYGRAFSQTTPEAGTTYVDEYWPNDLVKKARDARGVTRTLTYNRCGLLTDVDYSDQTPGVHYEC
jgi:YD repeat-containing protein